MLPCRSGRWPRSLGAAASLFLDGVLAADLGPLDPPAFAGAADVDQRPAFADDGVEVAAALGRHAQPAAAADLVADTVDLEARVDVLGQVQPHGVADAADLDARGGRPPDARPTAVVYPT